MDEIRIGQRELSAALRTLAADDASGGASAAVRLLDELRRRRNARRRSLASMALLVAGLCVVVIALPIWHLATRHTRHPSAAPQPIPLDGEASTAFFPLTYSTVPMSGGRVVRLELPRKTVTAFRLESLESPGDSVSRVVLADVIVGDDGLARAVRFVRPMLAKCKRSGNS